MVIKKESHGIEEEQYSATMVIPPLLISPEGGYGGFPVVFSCILN